MYKLLYSDGAIDPKVPECDINPKIPAVGTASENDRQLSDREVSVTVTAIDVEHDDPALLTSLRQLNSIRVQTVIKLAKAHTKVNQRMIHESEVAANVQAEI